MDGQAMEWHILLHQQLRRSTEWPRETVFQGSRPSERTREGGKPLRQEGMAAQRAFTEPHKPITNHVNRQLKFGGLRSTFSYRIFSLIRR